MKKGQVYKAENGSQIRIEEIEEVFYPFGDRSLLPRAKVLVTMSEEKLDKK